MSRFGGRLVMGALILTAGVGNLLAQGRLASRFGEATVGGQRVLVHVTVVVPPGLDENTVAENALRGQGARPFAPAAFSTTGLVWDQFFNSDDVDEVVQNYNSAGEVVPAYLSLQHSQNTWNAVNESIFSFRDGGTTPRCPSLVKECPGPQTFDGNNDVGWVNIGGCCTLAVTWSSSSIDEADIAFNARMNWTTTEGSGFDVETVILHENGHALGLGHTPVAGAIMEATYGGVQHTLHTDDERGVTYLYPDSHWIGDITGTVTALSGGSPIAGVTVSIPNFPVSATTDLSGSYTLAGIPDIGSYSVTASAQGFDSATQPNVTVDFTSPTTLDFQLDASSGGGGGGGGGGCIPRGPFGNNCP